MTFAKLWAESMDHVRDVIRDGRLVAMVGYYGTNNVIFAVFFPPWCWRRYENDNRKKRE